MKECVEAKLREHSQRKQVNVEVKPSLYY
jgi:hypothetical protein